MKMTVPDESPKPRIFVSYAQRDLKLAEDFRRRLGKEFDVRPRPSPKQLKSKASSLESAYDYVGNEIGDSDFVILLLPRVPSLTYAMAYEAGVAKAMGIEVFAIAPFGNWPVHETLLGLTKAKTFNSVGNFISSLKKRMIRPAPLHRSRSKVHGNRRTTKYGFGQGTKARPSAR